MQTVVELAAALAVPVPTKLPFEVGMGLDAALSRFAFTLSLLQTPSAVERVAREICEDAAAEGVSTLEIRFAPQLHLQSEQAIERIVDAALQGIAGRAGLILCGLYGEPPAVLTQLVRIAATRAGVVGIDLAGGPAPQHRFGMLDYAPAFQAAAALGIGRTVHAGEGRPAQEIRVATEALHAQRIGHGTTLLTAHDFDPGLLELVCARGVTLEACPSSNLHTGVIPSIQEHPLPQWLRAGVRVCINSDNTLFSQTSAREEHQRMAAVLSPEAMRQVIAFGHQGAFRRTI